MNFYEMFLQLEMEWPKPTLKNYDFLDVMGDYATDVGGQSDYVRYFLMVLQEIVKKTKLAKASIEAEAATLGRQRQSIGRDDEPPRWQNTASNGWEEEPEREMPTFRNYMSSDIGAAREDFANRERMLNELEEFAAEINMIEEIITEIIRSWKNLTAVRQGQWGVHHAELAKHKIDELTQSVGKFRETETQSVFFRSGRKKALNLFDQLLGYLEYVLPHMKNVLSQHS